MKKKLKEVILPKLEYREADYLNQLIKPDSKVGKGQPITIEITVNNQDIVVSTKKRRRW